MHGRGGLGCGLQPWLKQLGEDVGWLQQAQTAIADPSMCTVRF